MSGNSISIITAPLNTAAQVERAIQSVAAQTYPNTEHVIIDGASTDSTLEIVERYRDRLGYFVSEPDRGMQDTLDR